MDSNGKRATAGLYRELVRYGSLAASSHNTQPWKFRLVDGSISILPDFSRRCPIVDPDDHHLFVSLGCAAENLLIAADAAGLHGELFFDPSREGGTLQIVMDASAPRPSPLFDAIQHRQCTRAVYTGAAASTADLKRLEDAGTSADGSVLLLTSRSDIDTVAEYVAQGNTAQFGDRRFVNELMAWIRFNGREVARRGDGLSARATGSPEVPRWLGTLFMKTPLAARQQRAKDTTSIQSSAGVAVFVSERDDQRGWVDTGRRYERFALQATALGLRNAFVNQPVEVPALRAQFASWLGLGHRRPDLVVRFGYGPEMPRSPRRAVDEILL